MKSKIKDIKGNPQREMAKGAAEHYKAGGTSEVVRVQTGERRDVTLRQKEEIEAILKEDN